MVMPLAPSPVPLAVASASFPTPSPTWPSPVNVSPLKVMLLAAEELVMVSPVWVKVKSERGTWTAARGASVPFTYSWREFTPVPTWATQMLLAWSCTCQPVTCWAGVADGVTVLSGVGAGEGERLGQPVSPGGEADDDVRAGGVLVRCLLGLVNGGKGQLRRPGSAGRGARHHVQGRDAGRLGRGRRGHGRAGRAQDARHYR